MKKTLKLFRKALVYTLCFLGLSWQLFCICGQYFAYETTTQVSLLMPEKVVPPSIITCFNALAFKNLILRGRPLTAKSILNRSLAEKDFLGDAVLMLHDSMKSIPLKEDSISFHFNVSKFTKHFDVCYKSAIAEKEYDYFRLTSEVRIPQFFTISLNSTSNLEDFGLITISLIQSRKSLYGPNDNFVLHSRGHFSKRTNMFDQALVHLSYQHYYSKRLEKPYKTKCLNYAVQKFESRNHCYDNCVLRKSRALGSLPCDVLISEPLDIKIVMPISENNNQLGLIRKECRKRCSSSDCECNRYVPIIQLTLEGSSFAFMLRASLNPIISSVHRPLISTTDFITFVLSCISFWSGFSPMSFCGAKRIVRKRRGKKLERVKRRKLIKLND